MFSNKETHLLAMILRSDMNCLKNVCEEYLEKIYDKSRIFATEDFVYATGDIPILLVAHLDTVLSEAPRILSSKDNKIWMGKNGLGADDRAGIFAILKLIKKNSKNPSILFTTGEEVGGIGAMSFTKQFPEPPVPTKYIIEIDRRGRGQSVYYNCGNTEFEKYINSFGFKTNRGIFSDISFICPNWNVAGVNLSAGYYNEHTEFESLKLDDLEYTIDRVRELISDIDNTQYFNFEEKHDTRVKYIRCDICGCLVYENFITSLGEKKIKCCFNCLDQMIDWCEVCGEPYIPSGEEEEPKLCEVCACTKTSENNLKKS